MTIDGITISGLCTCVATGLGVHMLVTGGLGKYRSRRLAVPFLSSWLLWCGMTIMLYTGPEGQDRPANADLVAGSVLASLWVALTWFSIRASQRTMRRKPSEAEMYAMELWAKFGVDRATERKADKVSWSVKWAHAKAGRRLRLTEGEIAAASLARLRAQLAIEDKKATDDRLEDQFQRLNRGEVDLEAYSRAIPEESILIGAKAARLDDNHCGSNKAEIGQIDADRATIARRERWVVDQPTNAERHKDGEDHPNTMYRPACRHGGPHGLRHEGDEAPRPPQLG